MSESKTPLTDAEAGEVCSTESGCAFDAVNADFARRLERDRTELIEALDNLIMAHDLPGEHCETEQAISQARAILERLKVQP